jgi:hypothetical protein
MAITPGYKTNAEGEEEYFDKGAVKTVQYNPVVDARYQAAKAEVEKNDKVEWPTKVNGITTGY